MGLAGDSEDDSIFKRFQELCNDLNMDKDAANEAWNSYETIRQNYSLEGDQLHWLGCALHVACRRATLPTIGQSSQLVEGNLVSLTRLLRLCKISFIQFVNKIKKWADMTNSPQAFRVKVERLERNFAVSTVIFKKFQPVFSEMFVDPSLENQKQQRTKKQRNMPCTASRMFEFTWTLFICVKAEVPDVSDDLVNSYHLLLACCDLIYRNAILSDRRYLLNPNFSGLPPNIKSKDYTPPTEPQCIIYHLCQKHDGILMEAKSIKEYCWKNYVKKFFDKRILKGNASDFSELLENSNFEFNLKSVNRLYEEYVLSVGDFDERIFLGEDANNDIGTPTKIIGQTGIGDISERLQAKRNIQNQINASRLAPVSPLTGRDYLKSREPSNVTPVSTATQSVSRLQNMLSGHQASPTQALLNIFASCTENPHVEDKVIEMGNTFCSKYTQTNVEHSGSQIDFAKKRLHLATCLYYKLLENILTEECKKPNFDCNSLLNQDIFHQTLFACCLEIVLYSYNSQRTFPWILEALNIEPYHFYKIIEIIIRAEDQLSRDMVKHLNLIEEQILESLAWRSGSSLWFSLQSSNQPVPTCEDVSLPQQLSQDDSDNNSNNIDNNNVSSVNTNSAIGKTLVGLATVRKINTVGSTTTPVASVSERFQSPITMSGLTKKRLFLESSSGGLRTVKPGQSLLQNQQPQVVVATTVAANGQQQINTSTTSSVSAVTSNSIIVSSNMTKTPAGSTKFIPVQAIEVEDGRRYIPIAITPGSGSVLIQTTRPVITTQNSLPSVTTGNSVQNNSNAVGNTPVAAATSVEVTIPNSSAAVNGNPGNGATPRDNKENRRPRRTGSLGLFFRKFYHLASVRMQELCNQLGLMEVDLRRKIWTCFEHIIVEHTELMLNRHLDQILMCAVYVICKIVGPERTFTEVMRCYRLQPQCMSHVYRSVLLSNSGAVTATADVKEERGDLIRFYNTVYVLKVQQFVMRFSNRGSQQNENLTLSPLPLGKSTPVSPRRRISEKHSVYIRPLMTSESNIPPSPVRSLAYCFSRSPAKDLRAINTMIQVECGRKIGKRIMSDDNEDEPAQKQSASDGLVNRKVQGLVVDRLAAKTIDC